MADQYGYSEGYWGLPAPADGEFGWAPDEQLKVELIGRLFQRLLDAVGAGVITGGEGSIVAGNLALSALVAIIDDDLGAVPVQATPATLSASLFAAGDSYVHVQLAETARADGSCAYYISVSETPAADALVVCKVTKAGAVITAVDNTVKAVPVIAGRLPWTVLARSYDDATTLLALLTSMLGAGYLDGTVTDDVDARLTALETAPSGGGGTGTVYWGALQQTASVATTIAQAIAAAIAEHLATVQHGGADGVTEVLEPWDVDAVNQSLSVLTDVRQVNPEAAWNHVDAVTVVWGVYGDGSHGSPDFIDWVNSSWPA